MTFAVYTVGGITGAHINPAVTFGAAIRKQIPWNKVPRYWAAQVLGAFVGAALVFLVYNNAINNYDQVHHIVKGTLNSVSTYSTFATFPANYFSNVWGPLIDQIVGTFFLVLFVWAVSDEFNLPVGSNLAPFMVGMIVLAVGISFGANAGYAINPARDFGPRIFAWIAGWGKVAFPGDYLPHQGLLLDTDRRAADRRRARIGRLRPRHPGHPQGSLRAQARGQGRGRDRMGGPAALRLTGGPRYDLPAARRASSRG